jgi:serine/threonine protein kinase
MERYEDPIEYEIIGEGQGGRVIKYYDSTEEKYLAIKQIKKSETVLNFRNRQIYLTREEVEKLYREEISYLEHLNNLHSGYFPRFYGSYITEHHFNIVMEYIKGITLQEKLKEVTKTNTCLRAEYGWQLCDIFSTLARNNLIYFDLNRSNFIITSTNDVKLVDFGLTCGKSTQLGCSDTLSLKIFGKIIDVVTMLKSSDYLIRYVVGDIHYSDENNTILSIYEVATTIINQMGITSDKISSLLIDELFIYFDMLKNQLQDYVNDFKQYCI